MQVWEKLGLLYQNKNLDFTHASVRLYSPRLYFTQVSVKSFKLSKEIRVGKIGIHDANGIRSIHSGYKRITCIAYRLRMTRSDVPVAPICANFFILSIELIQELILIG